MEPRHLSKDQIERAIRGEPTDELREFSSRYRTDIDQSIRLLYRTHQEIADYEDAWPVNKRNDAVRLFLHVAYQSLFTALFLLVRGLPVPAGNMMRHYAEATAMALLCLEPSSGVLEAYYADRKSYPYAKCLERLTQPKVAAALRKRLGFDVDAWREFIKIAKFYNHHSHASVVAQGFAIRTGSPGRKVIGPDFDPDKVEMYAADFKRTFTAIRAYRALAKGFHSALKPDPRDAV